MMNPFKIKIFVLAALLAVIHPSFSATMETYTNPPYMGSQPSSHSDAKKSQSYGADVSAKLASGFANLFLGFCEIPKNIINTTNEINFAMGATGGVAKGVLHTAGRMLSGVLDVLTFPLPTEPITDPVYVWEDYTTETRYKPIFQIKN